MGLSQSTGTVGGYLFEHVRCNGEVGQVSELKDIHVFKEWRSVLEKITVSHYSNYFFIENVQVL